MNKEARDDMAIFMSNSATTKNQKMKAEKSVNLRKVETLLSADNKRERSCSTFFEFQSDGLRSVRTMLHRSIIPRSLMRSRSVCLGSWGKIASLTPSWISRD